MGQKKSPNTNVVDSVSENNVNNSVINVDNIEDIRGHNTKFPLRNILEYS